MLRVLFVVVFVVSCAFGSTACSGSDLAVFGLMPIDGGAGGAEGPVFVPPSSSSSSSSPEAGPDAPDAAGTPDASPFAPVDGGEPVGDALAPPPPPDAATLPPRLCCAAAGAPTIACSASLVWSCGALNHHSCLYDAQGCASGDSCAYVDDHGNPQSGDVVPCP